MTIWGIDYGYSDEKVKPMYKPLAQAGCKFAIVRGSEERYQDRTMRRDRKVFKEAGIQFGAFMFLRFPNAKRYQKPVMSPEDQANVFIDNLGDLEPGDLPPTLDVEFPDGIAATLFSYEKAIQWVERAYTILRKHYPTVMIYTSARVWQDDLANRPSLLLADAPLWIKVPYYWKTGRPWDLKHYRTIDTVPSPWREMASPGPWIQQIQGDATGMPGVLRTVDVNLFLEMKIGEKSERVKWVQKRIGAFVDGDFGSQTELALKAFQEKKMAAGEVNGIVDVLTFAALCA